MQVCVRREIFGRGCRWVLLSTSVVSGQIRHPEVRVTQRLLGRSEAVVEFSTRAVIRLDGSYVSIELRRSCQSKVEAAGRRNKAEFGKVWEMNG